MEAQEWEIPMIVIPQINRDSTQSPREGTYPKGMVCGNVLGEEGITPSPSQAGGLFYPFGQNSIRIILFL